MKKVVLRVTQILMLFCISVVNSQSKTSILGNLKKWHKVTLSFEGDHLDENDADNPFLNYRLNVIFQNKGRKIVVPGFFAADGNAAETSAKSGKMWQVRFMPDAVGEWEYEVSFRKGENIAVSSKFHEGEPTAFDGEKGKFTIRESDKTGSAFRTKGRLQISENASYLKYADTKELFLKGGTDSPENFLGYYEFDQTPPSHRYEPHANDWKVGDPTWQNGKGKNIVGALNYLASKKMNSVYFLTMNVQGDGKDVWPWTSANERYRFDCSKLDQWEIVFDHMDNLGLMLHIVTQETENELLLDIGELGVQRKLYYRELIARFSHHLGVTWNLGEENGPLRWTPKGQTDADRRAMAKYLKINDPYKNLVVLHTHSETNAQDAYLIPLLGYSHLDGPSLQTQHTHDVHDITVKWIQESKQYGKQWLVSQDEIGPADSGALPDKDDPDHDSLRHEVLWGNLMAGGAGVEWYFGYKYAHNDINCEDWRSRDILWDQTRYALEFFYNYITFENMFSQDDLTANAHDYVLGDKGNTYVVYLPKIQDTEIDLSGYASRFSIQWYNPRVGGALQNGTVKTVKGGKKVAIGFPPTKDKDWVALLRNKSKEVVKPTSNSENDIVLGALNDFTASIGKDSIPYYKDEKNNAFAINASKKKYRMGFAVAKTVFKGETGMYTGILNTMTENDGESVYEIKINNNKVKILTNPTTTTSFENVNHTLGTLYLNTNDTIVIKSNVATNDKILEGDETAWSRGRWNSLSLTKSDFLVKDLKTAEPFIEQNGLLEIEAENYHLNSNNNSLRKWYKRYKNDKILFQNSENHSETASNNAYIEALPDTRIKHKDKLIHGENFFPVPGMGGVVAYKVNITTPGKYFVWVRAYSSGSEDNGLHVGLNGQWPESGARLQLCKNKNKWTWSSAQRVPENHCGTPRTIYLDIKEAGEHIITFSMREDGFELDKFILSKESNFTPAE